MRTTTLLLAAGALITSPAMILAHPGGGGGGGAGPQGQGAAMGQGGAMGRGPMSSQPISSQGLGSTHGAGWDHLNGPTSTGQPGVECEDVRPGHSSTAPGSAFNEGGKAGTQYAGEKPQNSRNRASISQYDVACTKQPSH